MIGPLMGQYFPKDPANQVLSASLSCHDIAAKAEPMYTDSQQRVSDQPLTAPAGAPAANYPTGGRESAAIGTIWWRRRLFRIGAPLAAVAFIAVAVAFGSSGGDAAAPGALPPPPEVSVAQVLSRQVRQWDDFTGRVAAIESVELRPR
ncbi:MAG: hypothetical protein KIT37_06785, partial [Steroidobacteraceae bacterium]|nr:hypothetical protein [Steroidobacteraceae bacterium]